MTVIDRTMTKYFHPITGTILVFRIYAIVCAVFLVLFIVVNFYSRNEGGISSELPDDLDPKTVRNSNENIIIFKILKWMKKLC